MRNSLFFDPIYLVWLILALLLGAVVALLNVKCEPILQRIGDSTPASSMRNGDDFLEAKESYRRLLEHFHQENPANEPRPGLAADPDFKIIMEKTKLPQMGASSARDSGSFPLGFVRSDALWMVGRSAEADTVISKEIDFAGLTLLEKNLLTRKPQNRESEASPDRMPEGGR